VLWANPPLWRRRHSGEVEGFRPDVHEHHTAQHRARSFHLSRCSGLRGHFYAYLGALHSPNKTRRDPQLTRTGAPRARPNS